MASKGGEHETASNEKVKELEILITTLKKENTKLKNEMRFNLDQERRSSEGCILSLQRELEMSEAKNEELSNLLLHTEAELKNAKLSQAKTESVNSARLAAQSAALVERLSSVQREREKALAVELHKALEEKEAALSRVSKDSPIEVTTPDKPQTCRKDLQDLFDCLSESEGVSELQKNGLTLIKKVKELKKENERNIQEKVDLLRKESQTALAKKKLLDSEVARLRRQLEIMETEYRLVDKTRVKTLQAQLQAVLIERDEWQTRASKFEDTCETLRVLSSLQRSLSNEDEIKRKYENQLQKLYAEKAVLTDKLEQALQEKNSAILERNHVIRERNTLALQAQQEFERAERFQRLVSVLRKKAATMSAASGTGSLTPSYDI